MKTTIILASLFLQSVSALSSSNSDQQVQKRGYAVKHKCKFTKYGEMKPMDNTQVTEPAYQPYPETTTTVIEEVTSTDSYDNDIVPTTTCDSEKSTTIPAVPTTTQVPVVIKTTQAAPIIKPPKVTPSPPPPPPPMPKVTQNPPPPAPNPAQQSTYPSSFIKSCLDGHNAARAEVGLAPLSWDDKLANDATNWSKKLSSESAKLYHSTMEKNTQGENLYYKWSSDGKSPIPDEACKAAVGAWVAEKPIWELAGRPKTGVSPDQNKFGHYTQVVWKDTTKVGCGVASSNGRQYVTCRYMKPGNVQNKKPY